MERLSKASAPSPISRPNRFLLRTMLFVFTYLALRSVIEVLTPYHVGNDFFERKLEAIKREGLKPEVLFVGTSRVQGQIDPLLFDSLLSLSSPYEGISFNLGVHSSTMLESLYLASRVLDAEWCVQCKTLFIELGIETKFDKGVNNGKERGYYWLGPSEFIAFSRTVLSQSALELRERIVRFASLSVKLCDRYVGVGRFRALLMRERNPYLRTMDVQVRGYASLDDEEEKYPWKRRQEAKRRFDPSRIERRKATMEQAQKLAPFPESPALADLLNGFIEEAERSGVNVVFLSMPLQRNNLEAFASENLKPGHYINLSDPVKYPELFDPSIYYDNVHLNERGAELMTGILSRAYASLIVNGK